MDDTPFQQTIYAQNTFNKIASITPNRDAFPLTAGSATVEIIPLPKVPLAGYSARDPKSSTGAIDKVFAKAITISNGAQTITLLSADILLPLPQLINAVIQQTNLKRNQIYFSATHTHSGPGGYASGIVETMSMGRFSQKQFDILVNALSSATMKSRKNLQPVSLKYTRLRLTQTYANQFIHNQLNHDQNTHNSIHTLELIKNENAKRLATLVTFSAHPTFHGRLNRETSGDYPSVLMRELEPLLGGDVIFSAGAVGGMLPKANGKRVKRNIKNGNKQIAEMTKSLATLIGKNLNKNSIADDTVLKSISTWQTASATIQSEIIPVSLPFASFRISDNMRLSPLLINSIFHDNDTYIHALKIGGIFFLAYPADYAGELATSLEDWGNKNDAYPWTTSFNGEYIGYVMPSKHYDAHHYTVRDVSFFGRWSGDYFLRISEEIISQLK